MIGTWYFAFGNTPDEVALGENEFLRCIGQVQRLLPGADIVNTEVCRFHLGLVPVDPDKGKKFFLKNHHTLIDHFSQGGPKGLFTVIGAKYTTARSVACKTIEVISKKLNLRANPNDRIYRLRENGSGGHNQKFIKKTNTKTGTVNNLLTNSGSHSIEIENLTDEKRSGELNPGAKEAVEAELQYCIRNEFVYHLSDLLLRRTDIGSLAMPEDRTIEYCADLTARELGWNAAQRQEEISDFVNYYRRFS